MKKHLRMLIQRVITKKNVKRHSRLKYNAYYIIYILHIILCCIGRCKIKHVQIISAHVPLDIYY